MAALALGETLGRGAFGIVRRCLSFPGREELACKTTYKSDMAGASDWSAVCNEIRALRALRQHPGVVRLHAVLEDEVCVQLIMALCRGGDLLDRVNLSGPYTEREAAQVCATLAGVLAHCHSLGIVHRDVKPENVLLLSKSSNTDVQLTDFGNAVFLDDIGGASLSDIAGTTLYLAPEVVTGRYGQECDLWSLGATLFVLLSGRPPFWNVGEGEGEDIWVGINDKSEIYADPMWSEISPLGRNLLRRLLEPDPSKRLTAEEVLDHPWILQHCQGKGFLPSSPTTVLLDSPENKTTLSNSPEEYPHFDFSAPQHNNLSRAKSVENPKICSLLEIPEYSHLLETPGRNNTPTRHRREDPPLNSPESSIESSPVNSPKDFENSAKQRRLLWRYASDPGFQNLIHPKPPLTPCPQFPSPRKKLSTLPMGDDK